MSADVQPLKVDPRVARQMHDTLVAILDYWDGTGFSVCEPDCDCLVHDVRRLIACHDVNKRCDLCPTCGAEVFSTRIDTHRWNWVCTWKLCRSVGCFDERPRDHGREG